MGTDWWNISDSFNMMKKIYYNEEKEYKYNLTNRFKNLLNLPHSKDYLSYISAGIDHDRLVTNSGEQNRPYSEFQLANKLGKYLPYISDRPPSTRYLQIDTKSVGFPSVGEVEPLFCSLALWHVEAELTSDTDIRL